MLCDCGLPILLLKTHLLGTPVVYDLVSMLCGRMWVADADPEVSSTWYAGGVGSGPAALPLQSDCNAGDSCIGDADAE